MEFDWIHASTIGKDWVVPLVSSLLGGLVAGVCTLMAVKRSHKNELAKQDVEHNRNLLGLYNALRDEIHALWTTYYDNAGMALEQTHAGKPFNYYYPVSQEYFVVYTGNIHLIGSIPNDALRKSIVVTYTKAKGLIDSYRFNNDLVSKFEQANMLNIQTQNAQYTSMARAHLVALTEYTPTLMKMHHDMKTNVELLLEKLDTESKNKQLE